MRNYIGFLGIGLLAAFFLTAEASAQAEKAGAGEDGLLVIGNLPEVLNLFIESSIEHSFEGEPVGLKVAADNHLVHRIRRLEPELSDLVVMQRNDSLLLFANNTGLLYQHLKSLKPHVLFEAFVHLLHVEATDREHVLSLTSSNDLEAISLREVLLANGSQYTKRLHHYSCPSEGFSDCCCTGFLCGLFSPHQTCSNALNDCEDFEQIESDVDSCPVGCNPLVDSLDCPQ